VVRQPDTLETTGREAPLVLGRYRLGARLGGGGFGTVWEAHDERLDRRVAIKRIPLDGGENPRAEREALAAARLQHPAIVALYEAGHDDEAWWLVSELVHGRTLGELERDGALSDLDVVRVGLELCDALTHAHARGVVHRDVKPGNVMVADDGSAKLTDFGIARLLDLDLDAGALTRTGDVVGTIAYMAPEQAEGRRVTAAADLYALALVLYEALTGTNPIRADGPGATARRVGMRLPPLRRLRPDLPPPLAHALDAALDPDPLERGTVADLRGALAEAEDRVDDEPGVVTEGPLEAFTERTRTWRERRREPREDWEEEAWEGEGERVAERRGPLARAAAPRTTLLGRVVAGASAAALAAWACAELPVDLSLGGAVSAPETAAVAAAVGAAVALLPRLAWLTALAALLVTLGPDRSVLVVLAAALPVVALVPRHGALWSLPAAAPALGAIGLAGAYPALAGQARTLPARAVLGALGAWWLGIAEVVTDPRPDLAALTEPMTLALAALWAAAAAVLPLLVRGRRPAVDALAAAGWAAALAAATPAIAEALAARAPANSGAAAALGAGVAVAVRAWRRAATT
jgi:eukaryotic-like serine/threonine-protein kinase